MITINLGSEVEIEGTVVLTSDESPLDPTAAFGWIRDPDGVVIEYEYGVGTDSDRELHFSITRLGVGHFLFVFSPDKAGMWWAGLYSTGTGRAASDDHQISVRPSRRTSTANGRSNC